MKILIIEDEPQAASRLQKMIRKLEPVAEIVGEIDSVQGVVDWLNNNAKPDLMFMDIQLADGLSFEIFDSLEVDVPIIFTTAYDEYALKAFKVNSVDYLLKPIEEEDLANAIRKYKKLSSVEEDRSRAIDRISNAVSMLTKKFKERFVTKVGEHLKFIEVSDLMYFVSEEKITFGYTRDNKRYILDYTLEQIEGLVDPKNFFRINRKYIVSLNCIQDMISHTNSRLKIVIKGSDDRDVIVARERVQDFKSWLDN
ncbi:MAG: LytTR family DNA-binding domain-containing protein [Cyclobacteriaceae bacterium]